VGVAVAAVEEAAVVGEVAVVAVVAQPVEAWVVGEAASCPVEAWVVEVVG